MPFAAGFTTKGTILASFGACGGTAEQAAENSFLRSRSIPRRLKPHSFCDPSSATLRGAAEAAPLQNRCARAFFRSLRSGAPSKRPQRRVFQPVMPCPSQNHLSDSFSVPVGTGGSDPVKGHVSWYVVVRHDVLHVARILVDVVAVVLATSIYPLLVIVIEFVLIIRRQA